MEQPALGTGVTGVDVLQCAASWTWEWGWTVQVRSRRSGSDLWSTQEQRCVPELDVPGAISEMTACALGLL